MAGINMGSILRKLDAYMESSDGQKRIDTVRDDVAFGRAGNGTGHSVEEAASKFANTLIRTVDNTVFDSRVAEAIDYAIDYGKPIKLSNGKYMVHVWIGDTERTTMSTYKDYYPIQLADLYDQGVGHVMPQLFETVGNGQLRVSRSIIDGANYMETAVSDFLGNYGTEYNVVSIDINRN